MVGLSAPNNSAQSHLRNVYLRFPSRYAHMNRTLLLLAMAFLSTQACAQDKTDPMRQAFLEQQCKPELHRMLERLKSALPSIQIDGREKGICDCAATLLFQDKALVMIRDSDQTPPDPRLKAGDAKLQAYFFLKTTAAMHSCYASEFDSLARTLDPLKK
jgi:hypothetical protein